MKNLIYIIFPVLMAVVIACTPYMDEDINIGPLPEAPDFSVEVLASAPNKVVIRDLSSGFFSRVWDIPNGSPNRSVQTEDTILYTKAGDYNITLYAAKEGGSGTSVVTKSVNIAQDLTIPCDSLISLLTGECSSAGKKWTFSQEAGAIAVGPNPYSTDWFSSAPGALDPEQYNDLYSFLFEGNVFLYENGGQTVDPCDGYQAKPYSPPAGISWSLTPGAGVSGEPRITLPEDIFIGTRDSGPFYDIIKVTEDELVLHGPLKPCSPGATGWFTFKFVKAN